MDPVIKAYSDQGILALSFGILLVGAIWIIKYLLTSASDERKEAAKEREANRAAMEKVGNAMEGVQVAMQDFGRRLGEIERGPR